MNTMKNKIDFRNVIFNELIKIRKKNKNLTILSADLSAYTLDIFKKQFPKNFINLGITEHGMISIASGMAMCNKKVFAFSMIPFLILRSFEHLKVDISCTNMPVTLIGLGSGLSFDNAGPTAHSTTDIGLMRNLHNFTIFNPSDPSTAAFSITESYKLNNPSYVRLDKSQQSILYKKKTNFKNGYIETKGNSDICVISTGIMVHIAFELKEKFKNIGVDISILDLFIIQPINEKKLVNIIKRYKKIIILDENTYDGGISILIDSLVGKNYIKCKKLLFCLPKEHCFKYGSRSWLHKIFQLDGNSVYKNIKKIWF